MRRVYGAHPAHLAVLLAGLLLAVVAAGELLAERPVNVGIWFAAAAVLHDAAFLPAYLGADALLVALWRRHPGRVPWLNFVRVPAAVAGLLLLVYSTTILRLSDGSFAHKTGQPDAAYAGRWLLVTALLAAASGAWYATRVLLTRPPR